MWRESSERERERRDGCGAYSGVAKSMVYPPRPADPPVMYEVILTSWCPEEYTTHTEV